MVVTEIILKCMVHRCIIFVSCVLYGALMLLMSSVKKSVMKKFKKFMSNLDVTTNNLHLLGFTCKKMVRLKKFVVFIDALCVYVTHENFIKSVWKFF